MTRTSRLFPTGRRHADRVPQAAFEVTLWRALAVFRLVTFSYTVILAARNFRGYDHPYAAWVVLVIMGAWSLITISAYASPRARVWPLLAADFVVTAGCLVSSAIVIGPEQLTRGTPTLAVVWSACPVVAVAVARGRVWGAIAAIAMGAVDLSVRGLVNQTTLTGTVILFMAAIAIGHVTMLTEQAQERLRFAAEAEAASRERERLARSIHDSVLQVLALVQRRGEELGGEAAELGRLAGEQEVALRALIGSGVGPVMESGLVDLRTALGPHIATGVSMSAPATAVWLPAHAAREVAAAVGAALDNVRRHCDGAPAWILVEDEPDAVTVTVRDDGPGIPDGRLEEAEDEGRLGVSQSIRGRLHDLGGTVTITSAPNQGTEIEMRLSYQP